MRKNYTVTQLLVVALACIAGRALAQAPEMLPNPGATRTELAPIERLGVVDMSAPSEEWDPFLKTVQKIHVPGIDARKDEVRRLKDEANKVHAAIVEQGSPSPEKVTALWPPTVGTNFFGNAYGGGDPADNALAVSAGGLMISGNNTRFHTYDENGTQSSAKNFTQFASAGGVSTSFTFDPKCVYDPIEDRFVVTFLNGASSTSSKVILAFSQTNDPSGLWNVYAINGNVNNLGVWTDFVQIGLNTNEVFVTGNPFLNSGGSAGAAIWQIPKAAGYAGTAIAPVLHYLSGSFSVHPVQGGGTLYGPNMFFLESVLGSGNTINLHQITNSVANGGVLNSAVGFTMNNSYSIPPDADQRGTTVNLRTNDTRVQSSYYENNRIEFVLNTVVNGRSGIFHGTGFISPIFSFSYFNGELLGYSDLDISYPAVAYAGQQDVSGFNHSYISFLTSGAANYPGMGAVYRDEQGFSPKAVIREGVNFINSADDRWGDYSDLCERTGHPGEVWAGGTIGNSSLQQRTYIGQLLPPQPVAVDGGVVEGLQMAVSPNPATEVVKFEFPVDEAGEYRVVIRDLQGRTVKLLVENWLVPGKARLSFNAQYLPGGTYIVSVENESKQLFTERLVIQH